MALAATFDVGTVGAARTAPVFANSKKPLKIVTGTIAFDNSYPTGGEATTAISAKFATLQGVIFESKSGYVFEYDYTNNKVKAMWGDNNNAADGPLVEVANTTDLSAVTGVRFFAWGLPGAAATE